MFIEGVCARDGFRNLDLSKIDCTASMEVHAGHPDEELPVIGNALLSRRSDGHLWAEMTMDSQYKEWVEANCYFGIALSESEPGAPLNVTYLSLSGSHIDPEVKPVKIVV